MPSFRPERVAASIHREVATRLREGGVDPRLVDVSITRVTVTRDLEKATIHWLPLGGGEPKADVVAGLADAARQLRGPIGRALGLRHAAELVFVVDRGAEDAFRVSGLLDRLRRERSEGDP